MTSLPVPDVHSLFSDLLSAHHSLGDSLSLFLIWNLIVGDVRRDIKIKLRQLNTGSLPLVLCQGPVWIMALSISGRLRPVVVVAIEFESIRFLCLYLAKRVYFFEEMLAEGEAEIKFVQQLSECMIGDAVRTDIWQGAKDFLHEAHIH